MWWNWTSGSVGDLDGSSENDVRVAEDAVDAEATCFMVGDGVGDLVGGPSVDVGGAGVFGLVGWVVGDLRLVEVGAAAVAVPEHLILLVVFDEEAVGGDIVAVDDQSVGGGVGVPADACAVVGAPDPCVVDDGVVGVDVEVDLRATDACSAYAEEDVVEGDGISIVAGFASLGADLQEDGRSVSAASKRRPAMMTAVGISGSHGGGAVDGTERCEAEAHDDGVGVA